MIRRGTTFFPITPGGAITLPTENEAYRLVSAAVSFTVTNAAQTYVLRILDGANNVIHFFPQNVKQIAATGIMQWISGVVDMQNLIASLATGAIPTVGEIVCLPDDLWIQPQWVVNIAPDVWALGDIAGPYNFCLDRPVKSPKKGVAKQRIEPQSSAP